MEQQSEAVTDERARTLAAIERHRSDVPTLTHVESELDSGSSTSLRMLASSLRAAAWADVSLSADELDDDSEDPSWAPNASVRVAALLDHLSELAPVLGTTLTVPATATSAPTHSAGQPSGEWRQLSLREFREQLSSIEGREISIFDSDSTPIARATSWRGETVEIVDLIDLDERIAHLKAKASEPSKKQQLQRLEERLRAWGDAAVRAGFTRPHFGPRVTAALYARNVAGHHRVEITPDVNTIINGAVHHLVRVAPRRIDFARSPVTDLEIQRLADSKPLQWRKACRTLEKLPRRGPIWRTHSLPDATAMLVARAEQSGKKAPGADALLARNFEEARLLGHGIQQILLTADNGLARTLAARQPSDCVWLAYVDPIPASERFVSPMISWPVGDTGSSNSYSSLAELLDEALACGVDEELRVSDGITTIAVRSHLEGEHQYVTDWEQARLFVRGLPAPGAGVRSRPAAGTLNQLRWPLHPLLTPNSRPSSGARVTATQAAEALNLVTFADDLRREDLSTGPNARDEMWNFLRSIGVIDTDGRPGPSRTQLDIAFASQDLEVLRQLILRFDPVARVVASRGPIDIRNRTTAAAAALATAAGLVSRVENSTLPGNESPTADAFVKWLLDALHAEEPIGDIAELAATQLHISPIRFEAALSSVIENPQLAGSRGGGEVRHPMDSDVIRFGEDQFLTIQPLRVGSLLGLRSIWRRT